MFCFKSQPLPLPVVSRVVTPSQQEENRERFVLWDVAAAGFPLLSCAEAQLDSVWGKSRENSKPSAVLALLTLFQLQEEVGGPAWSNPKNLWLLQGICFLGGELGWFARQCLPSEQGHCQSWRITRAEIALRARKCVNSRN